MNILLALAIAAAAGSALAPPGRASQSPGEPPPAPAEPPEIDEAALIRIGMGASATALDSTLADSTLSAWIGRTLGRDTPVHWEVNDCGETSGSPADSARDLPICVEARTAFSGGRQLHVSVVVGSMGEDAEGAPVLWYAMVTGPDTSLVFDRLSDLERYIVREWPVLGDARAYVDARRNVHIVTSTNRDVRITKDGRHMDPKISPDGQCVGMLATSTMSRPGSQTYEPIAVATELWIYRGGLVHPRIAPGAYIRAWGFVRGGREVATYSGPYYGPGWYVLFDLERGFEIERIREPIAGDAPEWVREISSQNQPGR